MSKMPDAIVLCGGAGLRLRSVIGDAPKAMARIAGRPFMELLLRQLQRHGFQRVVLAVGYQMEVIRSYFGERAFGLHLTYSGESAPLGTGGAIRNAARLVESNTLLVMNGDSYTDVDLLRLVSDHREANADISLVVVPTDGRHDCGSVMVDKSGRLARFEERAHPDGAQYLSAGIYVISREVLHDIPAGLQTSIEQELFPRWLDEGKYLKAFACLGPCVDIGTPERLRNAQRVLANVEVEANLPQEEMNSSQNPSALPPPVAESHIFRDDGVSVTTNILRYNLGRSLEVHHHFLDACLPAMIAAANALVSAYRTGHKALFFGNGGSAADAQHLAAEFVGRYLRQRAALPALALNANTSALTAVANDYGYEQVFARQLEALAAPGDVAVAISTSGNSPNVIQAVLCARRLGLFTIALTGSSGGRVRDLVDVLIAAPSEETPRIQECHILAGHALCDAVEQALATERSVSSPHATVVGD